MDQPTIVKYGDYYLTRRIATGGMAELFRARKLGAAGFEKIMVVKRLLPILARNQDFVNMFLDEARLASQLNQQSIAQVYDLGKVRWQEPGESQGYDTYFIALEYVHGKNLSEIMKAGQAQGRPLGPDILVKIMLNVALALAYAHGRRDRDQNPLNIVHRDVSPANILVSYEGETKLVDFGIAKALSQSAATRPGVLKGKFAYMSPEQARGQPVDARSDIFSLGVVFWEGLTGQRLFLADSEEAVLRKVLQTVAPPPSETGVEVDPALEAICLKCLAPDRQERYASAETLALDLEAYLRGLSSPPGAYALRDHLYALFAQTIAEEEAQNRAEDQALRELMDQAHTPTVAGQRLTLPSQPPKGAPPPSPAPSGAEPTVISAPPPPKSAPAPRDKAPAPAPAAPPAKRGNRRTLLYAAGGLALAGLAAMLLWAPSASPPPPAPAPPAAMPGQAPASPEKTDPGPVKEAAPTAAVPAATAPEPASTPAPPASPEPARNTFAPAGHLADVVPPVPVPSTDALRQQVQVLLEQEDWPKALALIEEARKLEAGNQALLAEEEAAGALGLAKREMGRDPQKARALLLKATQGKPGWAEAWFQLGRVDTLLERHDEALSAYGQALSAEPRMAGAHFNQGYLLLKQGRTQEALQAYGRVVEIGGDLQVDAYLNLGVCHARLGQLDKAAAMFELVLSRRPGDALAQRYLQQVRPAAGAGPAGQPRQ